MISIEDVCVCVRVV